MERFGLSEVEFYMLPRDSRARHVAYIMIDHFINTVRDYESRKK